MSTGTGSAFFIRARGYEELTTSKARWRNGLGPMTSAVGYPFSREWAMSSSGMRAICWAMYRPAYG